MSESATPATQKRHRCHSAPRLTQNEHGCHQAPRLPHRKFINVTTCHTCLPRKRHLDVTKCYACQAKWPGALWGAPKAAAKRSKCHACQTNCAWMSPTMSPSAMPAKKSGPVPAERRAPPEPAKCSKCQVSVDITNCHACQAKWPAPAGTKRAKCCKRHARRTK